MPAAAAKSASQKPEGLFSSLEKRTLVLCLALAAAALLIYNPVTHHDFVNFDDDRYITDNPHVRAGLTWDTVVWAFRSTAESNWHPLTWLSHALDCQLFHLNPAGHHYGNVLIHAVNVMLLFFLLQKATGFTWRSLMVAALFALHPINVESVAWVAERKNVLCTLFFLLTLAAYGHYVRQRSVKRYLLVMLLFAFGLMSKPMVITLPFVLLLVDHWPLQRMNRNSFSGLLLEKVPLLGLSAASAVITVIAQSSGGAVRSTIEYSFPVRLENAIVAYALYLWKAVWPVHLAVMYPHPGDTLGVWQVLAAAFILLVITVAVLRFSDHRYLPAGWFYFLGTLVPVIGLVQVGGQAMADRYAYIPFLGLFVMAVWGAADWAASRPRPSAILAASAVVVMSLLVFDTSIQLGYWQNSLTLWSHALAVTDRNFVAHDNLGNALVAEGKYDEALTHFEAAAQINDRDPLSQLNIGAYQQQHGNLAGAVQQFQLVLRLTSDLGLQANALGNLGSAYRKLHDYGQAKENYEAALRRQPDNSFSLIGLGMVSQKLGDWNAAIEDFTRAMQIQPSDTGYLLLAQALEKTGKVSQAQSARDQAQQISPDLNQAQKSVDDLLQE